MFPNNPFTTIDINPVELPIPELEPVYGEGFTVPQPKININLPNFNKPKPSTQIQPQFAGQPEVATQPNPATESQLQPGQIPDFTRIPQIPFIPEEEKERILASIVPTTVDALTKIGVLDDSMTYEQKLESINIMLGVSGAVLLLPYVPAIAPFFPELANQILGVS